MLEDVEDEVIWETKDWRVLQVPRVVDARDCCFDVLGRSSELSGGVSRNSL
jgi:hypothetical protein